jgi:hypothetical protein
LINLDAGEHIFIEGNQFTENPIQPLLLLTSHLIKIFMFFKGLGKKEKLKADLLEGKEYIFTGQIKGCFLFLL